MSRMIGAEKYGLSRHDVIGGNFRKWTAPTLNLTVAIVCKECNNGWMSDLETRVAPVISRMAMSSGGRFSLTTADIIALAAFGFKTTVIADFMNIDRKPFFLPSVRVEFGRFRRIPPRVQMWLGALTGTGVIGMCHSFYDQVRTGTLNGLELYVLTYGVASVIIQVAAFRWRRRRKGSIGDKLIQDPNMDAITPQLWPSRRTTIDWPLAHGLKAEQIETFSNRWRSMFLVRGGSSY